MCLEVTSSWCGQVNWGNCGIPFVNCAVLCVKDDWKGEFWGLRYCQSKLRSLLSFFSPSGITSHSKIAQFNWECTASLRRPARLAFGSLQRMPSVWVWETGQKSTLESAIMTRSSSQHCKLVTNSPIIQRFLVHSALIQTQRPSVLIKHTVSFIFCQRCGPHCVPCKAFLSGFLYDSALDLRQYELHIL